MSPPKIIATVEFSIIFLNNFDKHSIYISYRFILINFPLQFYYEIYRRSIKWIPSPVNNTLINNKIVIGYMTSPIVCP